MWSGVREACPGSFAQTVWARMCCRRTGGAASRSRAPGTSSTRRTGKHSSSGGWPHSGSPRGFWPTRQSITGREDPPVLPYASGTGGDPCAPAAGPGLRAGLGGGVGSAHHRRRCLPVPSLPTKCPRSTASRSSTRRIPTPGNDVSTVMASAWRVKVSTTVNNRIRRPHASASLTISTPRCWFGQLYAAACPVRRKPRACVPAGAR